MAVAIGRVREDAVLDVRLVAMGHNTIRGAAGGSILNAELLLRGVAPAPPFLQLVGAQPAAAAA
jgi:aspartate-semialdehyde dehydrogenase